MTKHIKNSTVLKAARKRLASGKSHFICAAIATVRVGTFDQKLVLRRKIGAALRPYTYYDQWLKETHPAFYRKHAKPGFIGYGCKEGRLQWLDSLIEDELINEFIERESRKIG